jgi:hypothetical protein
VVDGREHERAFRPPQSGYRSGAINAIHRSFFEMLICLHESVVPRIIIAELFGTKWCIAREIIFCRIFRDFMLRKGVAICRNHHAPEAMRTHVEINSSKLEYGLSCPP